ncbi:MAG: phytanoyl-CoA dioxygenase family protein [Ignavibacteriaceae bacterium]
MVTFEGITNETALRILTDPLPDDILESYNSLYQINSNQINCFKKNGFISLKNVLGGEALIFTLKIIEAAVLIGKEKDKRTLSEKSKYEQSFLQCGYLCWDFPAVKDFVFGKRFAGIAKNVMEVSGVRLWHDQASFKEPNGRITDVHQDISYWPINEGSLTTTMWMALNDVPEEKGCLYFYPGSQKLKEKEYVDIFKHPHHPEIIKGIEKITAPLNTGDLTFHSGLTFHGARPNTSDEIREGITVIYIADGNTYDASDSKNSKHKSCLGLNNGDKIDTLYTPLLI